MPGRSTTQQLMAYSCICLSPPKSYDTLCFRLDGRIEAIPIQANVSRTRRRTTQTYHIARCTCMHAGRINRHLQKFCARAHSCLMALSANTLSHCRAELNSVYLKPIYPLERHRLTSAQVHDRRQSSLACNCSSSSADRTDKSDVSISRRQFAQISAAIGLLGVSLPSNAFTAPPKGKSQTMSSVKCC